ncbi:MOSC domain-containing protein [Cognatiyoonia koreensis]|uniref:MOSC domain-containing protein n=1 Tax=Cognatiyoonia koreensis TaxID=364200 RepID=A0A1I0MN37_9RHOB|nr:MOSC domain-containing protein [Cognatiyoonia koreensis]SEV89406.1 MOSC domain-containing protein [Cognatiyoonia koreensis]
MPALKPTQFSGTITWLGYVPHRDDPTLATEKLTKMPLDFGGYAGDCHAGLTRPSCSRVTSQHPRGTEIRNTRQLSIVSAEECAEVAGTLGLDTLDPVWVGASIVISGVPDFSHLPPSSRLQTQHGVTLIVDMQNRPCQFPAMTIARVKPGFGKDYKAAAKGKRGVTASVERCGVLQVGDVVTLHIPDQRAWSPE